MDDNTEQKVLKAVRMKDRSRSYRSKLQEKIFLVPGFITVLGMFCGVLAVVSSAKGNFSYAAKCIGLAIIIDGLDGRVARRLNATTAFGREFDSLSDLITFGVAPALLIYSWAFVASADEFGLFVSFLFVVCAATRLARFNIESEEKGQSSLSSFSGLPSPGAAGALAALVYCFPSQISSTLYVGLVMVYMSLLAILMVSTTPFLSIKKLSFGKGNPRILLALLATVVVLLWKYSHAMILVIATVYAWSGPIVSAWKGFSQRTDTEKARDKVGERGASMIEYAFLAALIAVVAIGAVTVVGLETKKKFEDPKLKGAFNSTRLYDAPKGPIWLA